MPTQIQNPEMIIAAPRETRVKITVTSLVIRPSSRHLHGGRERPITSLWWSGVAAGLSISFLFSPRPYCRHDAPWRSLISNFGYSAGYLMAVLSRQQLFTESTITAVLPVMDDLSVANCWRISRTWGLSLQPIW
jgi:formate/nitrite transporter FocA (FNT family)